MNRSMMKMNFVIPHLVMRIVQMKRGKSSMPFFSCYVTTRPYTWLDKYDTRQAENRRVSRLMEKENKKERDAAKKERNEAVRELIKFIRKRDKRVQMYSKKLAEK